MDDSFIHLSQPNDKDDSSDISTPDLQSSSESKDTDLPVTITFARDKSRGPSIDLMNVKGKFRVFLDCCG